eukprot:PhF_6_TR37163/c0_g1_i2/m.54711
MDSTQPLEEDSWALSNRSLEILEKITDDTKADSIDNVINSIIRQWESEHSSASALDSESFRYDVQQAKDEYQRRCGYNLNTTTPLSHFPVHTPHGKRPREDDEAEGTPRNDHSQMSPHGSDSQQNAEGDPIRDTAIFRVTSGTNNDEHTPRARRPTENPPSLEEVQAIVLTAKILKNHIWNPQTYDAMTRMLIRVRVGTQYEIMNIHGVLKCAPYEYDKEKFVVHIEAQTGTNRRVQVKLCVISNSPILQDEYDAAISTGVIPSRKGLKEARRFWDQVVLQKMDRSAVKESLQMRREAMESSASNVVAEKIRIERLMDMELENDERVQLEDKLQRLTSTAQEVLKARNPVVDVFIEKTKQNKEYNRRTPEVWKAVSNTIYARTSGRSTTFWEDSTPAPKQNDQMTSVAAGSPKLNESSPPQVGRKLVEEVHNELPVLRPEWFEGALMAASRIST